MKIIEANQKYPYKLMRNRNFYKEEYKELLYIVNKNIPNISAEEIIEMFKSLSSSGCSCAVIANILIEQIYDNEETFKNLFGFSSLSKNAQKIDCNKLMVDIYSKLYQVMKVRFIEYNRYEFSSIKEAALTLLGKDYDTEEASNILFKNGYVADGLSDKGRLLFKETKPIISTYIGTCSEIAKQKFGISGITNLDELKRICTERNVEIECNQLKITTKFSGLETNNFNFWINYYLKSYNVNYYLNKEQITVGNNYVDFMQYINQLMLDGYSISISLYPASEVYMHTKMPMTWGKVSSERSGHVMQFKEFNDKKDIVVSSYGKHYIIPKEYFQFLSFSKIKKFQIEKENNFDKSIDFNQQGKTY